MRGFVGALASCLIGCFLSPVPDTRTPADRAREIDPKCRGVAETEAAPLLSAASIDGVEPSYSYVLGGPNRREARFCGARIHIQPVPGATRESIVRALECHEASVLLGRVTLKENDPYTLPDRWLSIDVESERDGFAIDVRSDDTDDARRVLDRARIFAQGR
jgi:hypothetical protein